MSHNKPVRVFYRPTTIRELATLEKGLFMNSRARVAGFRYDSSSLQSDLKKTFERLEWRERIKSDTKVFVKPNFTLPFFKPGVTTHETVLEATLNLMKERASEVFVGESDGGYGSFTAEYSLMGHNVPDICKRTGAEMINLSEQERIRVTDRVGGKMVEVAVPRPLLSMDETISVPVLKVHVMTGVSLSLKNLWGCHPSTLRLMDHKNLSERLALLARTVHLRFVVVDAIKGLTEYGPMDGSVVDVGALLVGNNPVATDAVATRLMGFDPRHIRHILVASRYGLGPHEASEIDLLDDLSAFQREFHLSPKPLDLFSALTFRSNLISRLVFDSPFTMPIYRLVRRRPGKSIQKAGDEL